MKTITITPVYHLDTNNGRDEEVVSDTSIYIKIDVDFDNLELDNNEASYSFVEAILKNGEYINFLKTKYNKLGSPDYSYFRIKLIKIDDTTYDLEEVADELFEDSAMKWFDNGGDCLEFCVKS